MPGLYSHVTRTTGTILTASIYNTDHQNHIDNQTLQMTDDFSTDLAESRTQVDPVTLATASSGEISRLRFIIAKIAQVTFWDQALALLKKAGDTVTGALTVSGGASPTSGVAANVAIGGGGASPIGATITWGDNSGWRFTFGTIAAGVFTQRVQFYDTGRVDIVTGPLTLAAVSGVPVAHALYRENVSKAWIKCDFAGGIQDSFNVVSIVDVGNGQVTVNWDRDFATANYGVTASVLDAGFRCAMIGSAGQLAASCALVVRNESAVATDGANLFVHAIGDQ